MEISEWSRAELDPFQQARRRWGTSIAYEQTWLYLCQALRRGGWVCRNEAGWVAVAADYLGKGRHALVVPMSNHIPTFVKAAADRLRSRGIRPVVVKHIAEGDMRELAADGSFAMENGASSVAVSYLEDLSEDRFPQVIVDFSAQSWTQDESDCSQWVPLTPPGPESADFRYQLRRFCRAYPKRGISVERENIAVAPSESIDEMLDSWMRSVRHRFRLGHRPVNDYDRCFREPVESVIHQIRQFPEDGFGSLISVEGVPAAHWVAAQILKDGFGIYTVVADTSIRNLAHFTMYSALLHLYHLGARTVNLGGSEEETLFRFKSRVLDFKAPEALRLRPVFDFRCELE